MNKSDHHRLTLAFSICVILQFMPFFATTLMGETCRQIPESAWAWWPGDGHGNDLLASHDAVGNAGYVPAVVGQGFAFDGSSEMVVAGYPDFRISQSVAGWIRIDQVPASGEVALLDKREPGISVPVGFVLSARADASSGPQMFTLRFTLGDGNEEFSVDTLPLSTGEFHYVTVTLYDHTQTMHINVDGVTHDTSAVSDNVNATNGSDLFIGRPAPEFAGQAEWLVGVIDELIVGGDFYDACEIAETIAAGSSGICRGDTDGDGLLDYADNCPFVPNPDQANWDSDRAANPCGPGDYGSGSSGEPRGSPVLSSCAVSPADLCEQTDGTWDPASCYDYICGVPRDCFAVIPGCDCGPTANYRYGLGCEEDPACL